MRPRPEQKSRWGRELSRWKGLNVLGVLQESKSPCFVGYRWLAMVSSASSETRTCEFSEQYGLGPLRDCGSH